MLFKAYIIKMLIFRLEYDTLLEKIRLICELIIYCGHKSGRIEHCELRVIKIYLIQKVFTALQVISKTSFIYSANLSILLLKTEERSLKAACASFHCFT